jgi:hypothetical protein
LSPCQVSAKCQASLDRTQAKLKKAKAWSWQQDANGGKTPSEFSIETLNSSNESTWIQYNGRNNPWKATRNKISSHAKLITQIKN